MLLETQRLMIRSIRPSDEKAFIEMASDGSLTEIYGDCSECHKWMGEFIKEAMKLEMEDDPYHAYVCKVQSEKTCCNGQRKKHCFLQNFGKSRFFRG